MFRTRFVKVQSEGEACPYMPYIETSSSSGWYKKELNTHFLPRPKIPYMGLGINIKPTLKESPIHH